MNCLKLGCVLITLCLVFVFSQGKVYAQSCSGGANYVDYSCAYDLIEDEYQCVSNGGMYISCAGSPCEAFGPVFCFPHSSGCTISSYGDSGVCTSNEPNECGSNCSTSTSVCGSGGCARNQVLVTKTCDGNGDGRPTQCNSYCRNESTCIVDDCGSNCSTSTSVCGGGGCAGNQVRVIESCDGNGDGRPTQCNSFCRNDSSCTRGECTSNCSTSTGACGSGGCLPSQRNRQTTCDGNGDGVFTTCSNSCVNDSSCNPDPPKYSCNSNNVCVEDPNGSCDSCTGCCPDIPPPPPCQFVRDGICCSEAGENSSTQPDDCGFRAGCDYLLHPSGACGMGYRSLCDAARVPGAFGSGNCNLEASAITLPDASTDQVKFDFRCANGWGYTGINGSCSESTSFMGGLAILKKSEGSNASLNGGQQYKDHDWAFIGTLPNGQSSITLSDRTGFAPGTNTYKVLPRCAIRKDESSLPDKYGYKRIPNDLVTTDPINRCTRDYSPCYSIDPPVPILSGPSSACIGANTTYSIFASDSCPFTKVEVWMSPASPVNPGGDWTLLKTSAVSGKTYSGTLETSFSMAQDYWLVANAYDGKYQCSGNPFLSDSELAAVGFTDCGDGSRILVSPISVIRDDPNDPNDGIVNLRFVEDPNDKSTGTFSWSNTTPPLNSSSFYIRRLDQNTGIEENSTTANLNIGTVYCDSSNCSVTLSGLSCPNSNYLYGVGISDACNSTILSNYIKPNDYCSVSPTVSITIPPPERGCRFVPYLGCVPLNYTKYYSDLLYEVRADVDDIDSSSVDYSWSSSAGSFFSSFLNGNLSPLPNYTYQLWYPGSGPRVAITSEVYIDVTDSDGNSVIGVETVTTELPEFEFNIEVKYINKLLSNSVNGGQFCEDAFFNSNDPNLKDFNSGNNGKYADIVLNPNGSSPKSTFNFTTQGVGSNVFGNVVERLAPDDYTLQVNPRFSDPGYETICIMDVDNGYIEDTQSSILLEGSRETQRNFRAVVAQRPPKGWLQAYGAGIFTGLSVDYDLPYDNSVVHPDFVNNVFNLSNQTVTSHQTWGYTEQTSYSGIAEKFVVSEGSAYSGSGGVGPGGVARGGGYVTNCLECSLGLAEYISNLENNLDTQPLNTPIPNFWLLYNSPNAYSRSISTLGSTYLYTVSNTGSIFVLVPNDLTITGNIIDIVSGDRSNTVIVVPGNLTISKNVQFVEASFLVGGSVEIEAAVSGESDFEKDVPLVLKGSIHSVGNITANRNTSQKSQTDLPINNHYFNSRPVETFVFQPQMFLGESPSAANSLNIYLNTLD